MLIPTDWQFQGEVRYAKGFGCPEDLAHPVFRASHADSQLGVELLPGQAWQWASDRGTVQAMQTQAQQMAYSAASPAR